MKDKTALSYWFPKLVEFGIPVPKTIQVRMPAGLLGTMLNIFDGDDPGYDFPVFVNHIKSACDEIGYPCFLRTDHTSAKHEWSRSCFVQDGGRIANHICRIVEYSEICGMFGELPWEYWAVREYLPIHPFGVCLGYENMPICREFRFFVEDGAVRCFHPYWPLDALELGGAEDVDYEELCALSEHDEVLLRELATCASHAVPGAWSVDILDTERGWFVTDMAEAHKSFHFPGCEQSHE